MEVRRLAEDGDRTLQPDTSRRNSVNLRKSTYNNGTKILDWQPYHLGTVSFTISQIFHYSMKTTYMESHFGFNDWSKIGRTLFSGTSLKFPTECFGNEP